MNPPVPSVGVAELAEALRNGATLIDVREPSEFVDVRVRGASLVPLSELMDRADDLPATDQFFVICHVGGRSMRASAWMRAQGLDAVNVAGGMDAWIAAGLETISGPADASSASV